MCCDSCLSPPLCLQTLVHAPTPPPQAHKRPKTPPTQLQRGLSPDVRAHHARSHHLSQPHCHSSSPVNPSVRSSHSTPLLTVCISLYSSRWPRARLTHMGRSLSARYLSTEADAHQLDAYTSGTRGVVWDHNRTWEGTTIMRVW